MAESNYNDSNYRFTDPIRFFKANDPYYFEVENIPLKQLQENCLWLKDQVKKTVTEAAAPLAVVRADLEELRPYATGADRVVRVKPGRYTARINDASSKQPLAYLKKVFGEELAKVDTFSAALPNAGSFENNANAKLKAALETFQTYLSQGAQGMTGLEERVFTWPVINSDTPVNLTGAQMDPNSETLSYGGYSLNSYGWGAEMVPTVVAQALVWAKSIGDTSDSVNLGTFDFIQPSNGWAKLPRLENFFIKKWRGIARLAIVDVDSELSIEVPEFNANDFSYINSEGIETEVPGMQNRIDMIFIYSKPIDMSGVNILTNTGKQKITKPQLGIVRGAGIRASFKETANLDKDFISSTQEDHRILASPGDQFNNNMGFTSASGNDIAADVRGSFPSPDDILNIAPLLSEKLEDTAFELVGQSILPVAYVWVQDGSEVVLTTDVIDIRPFFRTAELTYNERAGLAAAFPQLSIANPAVGKGQLDYEIKRTYDDINAKIDSLHIPNQLPKVYTGYVYGGWFFGPEGAILNYKRSTIGGDVDNLKSQIIQEYGYGKDQFGGDIEIPNRPTWDLGKWTNFANISNKGQYPNDYWSHFLGQRTQAGGAALHQNDGQPYEIPPGDDDAVVASSYRERVLDNGLNESGATPAVENKFAAFARRPAFSFVSKTINFTRPDWMKDYHVDCSLVNCLVPSKLGLANKLADTGSFYGVFVEKGETSFTIYVCYPAAPRLTFPQPEGGEYVNVGWKKILENPENFRDSTALMRTGVLVNGLNLGQGISTEIPSFGAVSPGTATMGICTYPTVSWKMTAIPMDYTVFGNINSNSNLLL